MFTIFQAFNKKLYQDLQYNRDLRVTFNNITEDNISRKSGTKTLNTIPVSGSTVPHHSIRETARKKSKRAYCERSGEMTRRDDCSITPSSPPLQYLRSVLLNLMIPKGSLLIYSFSSLAGRRCERD